MSKRSNLRHSDFLHVIDAFCPIMRRNFPEKFFNLTAPKTFQNAIRNLNIATNTLRSSIVRSGAGVVPPMGGQLLLFSPMAMD